MTPPVPGLDAAVIFGANGAIGGALVTGLLARDGHDVVHAGVRDEAAGVPDGAVPFRFDLEDEASIAQAAQAFASPPGLVVIATGMLHDAASGIAPEKSYRSIDGPAMARVLALNTIGPALIAKHVLPLLPRNRRAVFAVLSARVGSITDNRLGGWHAYRASKAALNMLVRNFAIELARSHPLAIVVALHPGTVDSRLSGPFQRGVKPGKLLSPQQSAHRLLDVIDGLSPADSGAMFAWDGTRLPE